MLAKELRTRATNVCVSWVKGHATRVDAERGRTTEEDKTGNDGADALAVAGAALHTVSVEVVGSARQRRKCATSVQKMMLAVLKARLRAEHEQNDDEADGADRGSEIDCMDNLLFDDEFGSGADDGQPSASHDRMELDCIELACIDSHINDESESGDAISIDEP